MKKYNIGISVVLILLSALMIRSSLQSGAAVQPWDRVSGQ